MPTFAREHAFEVGGDVAEPTEGGAGGGCSLARGQVHQAVPNNRMTDKGHERQREIWAEPAVD